MNKEKKVAKILVDYYKNYGRDLPWRHNRNPYRVWISEIMLQQTRVEAVKSYYARFIKELPDIKSLAKVEDDLLMKLWEGLGYYTRARNLKKCAIECYENFGGEMPKSSSELEKLSGIGKYTAAAIASFCYEENIAALDGNGLRVFARLYGIEENILSNKGEKIIREIMQDCVQYASSSEFNQAVMDFASAICLPKKAAKCEECPLQNLCVAYENKTVEELPIRLTKKAKKEEEYTVLVYVCNNKLLLKKRPTQGMLANLYGFEMVDGNLDENRIICLKNNLNEGICKINKLGQFKHVFSHKIWKMNAIMIQCNYEFETTGVWVNLFDIVNQYALPSAFSEIMNKVSVLLIGGDFSGGREIK